MYSEYDVSTPEYLTYSQRETGYFPIEKETDNRSKSVDITYSYVPRGQAVSQKSVHTVNYREDVFRYSVENIPAFPVEKYLNTYENYIGKVDFELQSTNYPNQTMEVFSTTWEKVNNTMLENYETFTLKKDRHLKDVAEVLLASNKEGVALINLALQRIKKHFAWNGVAHKYSLSTLAKAYKDKSGNCADINLNLVMLLRELGFASNPVILSTQDNGIIKTNTPSVSDFNYVIALVKFKSEIYLLDATDPYSEINLLPLRCLNGKGKVINRLGKEWVDLINSNSYKSTTNYELTLGDDLTIKGKGNSTLEGYAAYLQRVKAEKGNTKSDKNANLIIENSTSKGVNTLGADIELAYDITQKNYAEKNADLVYFSPALDPYFKKNPFKLEKREFPVEFDYSSNIQQMYSITIPDGYEVSEIPKPLISQMSDKSIKFMYQVTQVGNKINVMSMLNIKKELFVPEEYEGLKSIFQMIADKQKEFVVLKKK